jgi:uncharacterized protein YlxW (UPF0749 family)
LTRFDLRALVETLNAHKVEFIAIGGVAVGAQGLVRATGRAIDLADLEGLPEE